MNCTSDSWGLFSIVNLQRFGPSLLAEQTPDPLLVNGWMHVFLPSLSR